AWRGGWPTPRRGPRRRCETPGFVGFPARCLLTRLERARPHIREEDFLVRAREDLDGLFQRQPFDGFDIVHRLAQGPADDSHMPELYDFDPAIDRVQH